MRFLSWFKHAWKSGTWGFGTWEEPAPGDTYIRTNFRVLTISADERDLTVDEEQRYRRIS